MKRRKPIETKTCEYCKKDFERNRKYGNARWVTTKFCSAECRNNGSKDQARKNFGSYLAIKGCTPWNKGKKIPSLKGNTNGFKKGQKPWNYKDGKSNCMDCGKKLTTYKKPARCQQCRVKFFVKDHIYNWKGGVKQRFNTGEAYKVKSWAKSIYARDHFTCWMCGTKGKKIEAHHIDRWVDAPDKRFDIANGITLCKDCHLSIRNTESDWSSWFNFIISNNLTNWRYA